MNQNIKPLTPSSNSFKAGYGKLFKHQHEVFTFKKEKDPKENQKKFIVRGSKQKIIEPP